MAKNIIFATCQATTYASTYCFFSELYKLTDEVLGQGAYAKVQGCISLQNGKEFAVKVSENVLQFVVLTEDPCSFIVTPCLKLYKNNKKSQ